VPPDPAVITGQREPGERAIPRKHHTMDKNISPSIELNERNRPITEDHAHDEMIARQIFAKHSPLDPPKHEKRHHASRCTSLALSFSAELLTLVLSFNGLTNSNSFTEMLYFTLHVRFFKFQ
jgi:hypothetical protein